MSERRRTWGFVVVLALVAGAILAVSLNRRAPPGVNPVGDGDGIVGQLGIETTVANQTSAVVDWKVEPTPELPSGRFPLIRKDANLQVTSVAEALHGGKHPERLSPLISPAKYDPVTFQQDPKSYLNTVEPGRVWQVAQPGANVKAIKSLTPYFTEAEQGQAVALKVKANPGAPVTYTAFDGGAFQNLLTSITVQADADGVASAQFTGTTGVVYDVDILVGSPLNSGQVSFVVNVLPPRLTATGGAK